MTASEAGQQKRLLLLDTNWQQVDSIPISIGRKYFSLSTPAAATNAAISSSNNTTAAAAAGGGYSIGGNGSESDQDPNLDGLEAQAAGAGVLQLDVGVIEQLMREGALRSGDLVHVRAEQDDSSEAEVMQVVRALADKGARYWLVRMGVMVALVLVVERVRRGGVCGDLVHVRAEQDDSNEAAVMQVVKALADKGELTCLKSLGEGFVSWVQPDKGGVW